MQATGFLRHASETRKGESSRGPWMARDYVIETDEQYPKKIMFTVFGEEKLKQFALKKDELIEVYFDIEAHEYNGRWFNSIRAWKVERPTAQTQQTAPQTPTAAPQQPQAPWVGQQPQPQQNNAFVGAHSDPDDELPF